MTALDDLADRYVEDFAALDPCSAAFMGIAGQDDRLTDYSPDGFAARTDLARRTLASLDALPVNGGPERIAAAVLRERAGVMLELSAAGVLDAHLALIMSPLQHMHDAVDLLVQGPDTRWEAMLGRIGGLPAALEGLRESLTRARQEGRVAALRQVRLNIDQCGPFAGFLADSAAPYGAGPLREPLDRAVREAGAALESFRAFLADELAPYAPDRDGAGRDRYELAVRNHLGTRVDLAETYAWGWEELARIEAEMAEAAARIAPGEPVAAVQSALDANPAYRIKGADAFRAYIQGLVEQAIEDLDGVHFDIPAPLRQISCTTPPEGGIYYLAPAEDMSRPGRVWWSVHDQDGEISTWAVPATMYHEGVPGHHLQLGAMTFNTRTLNRFQRVCSELHPGHAEGWGLYAERLMDELGYYTDPAHRFGMLAGGQQMRAARVILDIGMHLELPIPAGTGFHEGERWNRELGLEFLRLHSGPDDEPFIAFEIDRYLGVPGQAIAYKVGERVWLEAREAARARAGASFDLKAFHQTALDMGPMGLDLLRAELNR